MPGVSVYKTPANWALLMAFLPPPQTSAFTPELQDLLFHHVSSRYNIEKQPDYTYSELFSPLLDGTMFRVQVGPKHKLKANNMKKNSTSSLCKYTLTINHTSFIANGRNGEKGVGDK